jgi:hypothetical protein
MAALNMYSKPREIKTIRDFLRAGSPCPHKKMQLIRCSLGCFRVVFCVFIQNNIQSLAGL